MDKKERAKRREVQEQLDDVERRVRARTREPIKVKLGFSVKEFTEGLRRLARAFRAMDQGGKQ